MTVFEQVQAIRAAMDIAGAAISDKTAVNCAAIFPLWTAGVRYSTGERRRFADKLYKCLQDHDAQADWTPAAVPALWVRIDDPAIEWPAWVQPDGAMDAYSVGAKVSHAGIRWTSDIDVNVWEPGIYGWSGVQ